MAKVIMHKAADGSLHEKARECEAHNITIRMREPLQKLAKSLFVNDGAGVVEENGAFFYVEEDSFADFIIANASALRTILNDAQSTKRPRKAKLKVVEAAALAA